MASIFSKRVIVCGLSARSISLEQKQAMDSLDVMRIGDSAYSRITVPKEVTTTAMFEFTPTYDELTRMDSLFPVGEGHLASYYLGPTDVCKFCGSAWLPGTLACPSCGGETDHFDKGIEYHAANRGVVTEKRIEMSFGFLRLSVTVEFSDFEFSGTLERMFEHSLWRNSPAVWVCQFCGFVVLGKTSDCPGCGGKRYKLSELSTKCRQCVYCGRTSWGNYACKACNQRLLAVPQLRN